jgi:hypothetical protein
MKTLVLNFFNLELQIKFSDQINLVAEPDSGDSLVLLHFCVKMLYVLFKWHHFFHYNRILTDTGTVIAAHS